MLFIKQTCVYEMLTYKCPNCKYETTRNSNLKKHHTQVHTNIRPFECLEVGCGAKFATNGELKTHHTFKHTNIRPFECLEVGCGAKFKTTGELKRHHTQVHTNIRPFECLEVGCGAKFKTTGELKTHHTFKHTTIRPFECLEVGCGAKFATNGDLKRHHTFKHTTIRPFECLEVGCGAKFATNGDLKKHRRIHMPNYIKTQKIKEDALYAFLRDNGIVCEREVVISYRCMDRPQKFSRLDFVIYKENQVIVLECDEHYHKYEEMSCEQLRMFNVLEAHTLNDDQRPIHWIRYNPDAFKVDGVTKYVTTMNRRKELLNVINNTKVDNHSITYLYYPMQCDKLVIELSDEFALSDMIIGRIC